MSKYGLRLFLAMGLVLSLLVGAMGTASAQDDDDNDNNDNDDVAVAVEGTYEIYFPWVPNGNVIDDPYDFGESGPYYGTVTIQNLENYQIFLLYRSTAGGDLDDPDTYSWTTLDPYASITLDADQLGVPDPGAGVVALGIDKFALEDDGVVLPGRIAGVQKQAAPIPAPSARTSGDHLTVGGYTALTEDQVIVGQEGNRASVLPIVQTNENWNTQIRVTNIDPATPDVSSVTVTLYEADTGVASPSVGQFTAQIGQGETATFDLSDEVPEGFVGSAHISANYGVVAAAERIKVETNMLIMNTSQPSQEDEVLALFGDELNQQNASLVFQDYHGWNTGISVANLSDEQNTVTVNFYGPTGNVVGQESMVISPRAMQFVYMPSFPPQDVDLGGPDQTGFIGSASLDGTAPFHAAVDEVKYFGAGEDVGHAMSYMGEWQTATGPTLDEEGIGFTGDLLAMPLVQKGQVAGASGDTSGIQLFNPDADNSVTAHITLRDATGALVAPTIDTPISVTLSPHQNFTFYAHHYADLPEGFQGSALVQVQGAGELVGISNNVNYDVQYDGSAAYNMPIIPGVAIEAPPVVDIELDPADPDPNPFLSEEQITAEVVAAIEEAIVELDLEDEFDGVDVADRLAAHGGDVEALVQEWIDSDEINITAFQAGEILAAADDAETGANAHTVTATVTADGEPVTDALVQFVVTGANEDEDLIELDDAGQADFTYTATAAGEDTITATVPGAEGSATATKTWVGVGEDAVAIELDPEEAENPYVLEAEPGTNVHTVTSTFVDAFGNQVNIEGLDEEDFDVEVQVLDQFGTPQDTVEPVGVDVDADTGVATITYDRDDSGQDISGSDLILVSVTLGEDDDAVTFDAEATKTWVEEDDNDVVDPDPTVTNLTISADPENPTGLLDQTTTLTVEADGVDLDGEEVEVCRDPAGATGAFAPGGDQECVTLTLDVDGEASVDYTTNLTFIIDPPVTIEFTATHDESGESDSVSVTFTAE